MHITGVVLAGGKSQRMGQNKATLLRHDQSMLSFTHALMKQVSIDVVHINTNIVPSHINAELSTEFFSDVIPECGPLSGIHAAMHYFQEQTDALVFLPVDMPFMEASVIQEVIEVGKATEQIAHFQRQPFPLFVPMLEAVFDGLCERLMPAENTPKRLGLLDFCQSQNAITLATEKTQPWLNTNTPAEWEAALKLLDAD